MPTPRCLRPLSATRFQVIIADRVVAILDTVAAFATDIYILANEVELLETVDDADPVNVAHRLAEGEFDNDFRFEIVTNPEPDQPSNMYFVSQIATPSQIVTEAFTTDDPYSAVEAAREAQMFTFEERLGEFGLEWQREQREAR